MADTQKNLSIASLGTREAVIKVDASVILTAGADATNTVAVTFDKAFVDAPEVIGVVCTDADVIKGSISATAVTTTGMNVNIYQVLQADVASATYVVEVSLVGWKAS